MRVVAYVGALAVLAIMAASFLRPPAGIAAIDPSPQPQWLSVERPHPAFELLMPELAGSTANYAIERRAADGARKDVLTWGEAAGGGPYVMVEIYRPGATSERFIDAPSEVAARIVKFTVTDDVKPAGQIDSKFGAVPLVDFAIAAQGRATRRCLGFARPFDEPAMQISGWYCSAGEEVVDRATLACALDRLTILSAGGDSQARRACSPTPSSSALSAANAVRSLRQRRNVSSRSPPPRSAKLRSAKLLRGRIRLR